MSATLVHDPAPSTVEVTPVLTYGERLRVTWLLTLRSPIALFWVLLPSACGLLLLLSTVWRGHSFEVADTTIIAVSFAIIPVLQLLKVRRQQRVARANGPHRYRFDHEGLRITTPNTEVRLRWAAIPRVREHADVLFVYIDRHVAHCLPMRTLTRGEADAIVRLAREAGVARIDVPRT